MNMKAYVCKNTMDMGWGAWSRVGDESVRIHVVYMYYVYIYIYIYAELTGFIRN